MAKSKTKVQHDSSLSVNHNNSAWTADAEGGAKEYVRSDVRRIVVSVLVRYVSTTLWTTCRTTTCHSANF